MKEPINPSQNARLITLDQFISELQALKRRLTQLAPHDLARTLIGLDADDVRRLNVLVCRTEAQQVGLGLVGSIQDEAVQELELTKQQLIAVSRLAARARDGTLSAEALVTGLRELPDVQVARKRLGALDSAASTVFDEEDVLLPQVHQALPSWCHSQTVHRLTVTVLSIDLVSGPTPQIKVRLQQTEDSALFSQHHLGRLTFPITVKTTNALPLSVAVATGIAVRLDVTMKVRLADKGRLYAGSLVKFVDPGAITRDLKRALDTDSLFSTETS